MTWKAPGRAWEGLGGFWRPWAALGGLERRLEGGLGRQAPEKLLGGILFISAVS